MNHYKGIKRILSSVFGITVLFAANHACATVVDFEGAPSSVLNPGQSVVSQGFKLTEGNGQGAFAEAIGPTGQGATDFSGNGTTRLIGFNQSSFTFVSVANTPFSLLAFDGGESWVYDWVAGASKISVTGTTVSGAQVNQVFDLDLIKSPTNGMQTFTFDDSFRNLSSAVFVGAGSVYPEFSLDNIVVSAVPEPASIALLGLGLAGIGALRRKSKQNHA